METKSRYHFPIDPGESMKIQASAYKTSRLVCRPPRSTVARPHKQNDAGKRIVDLAKSYRMPNGLSAAFSTLRAKLSFELSSSKFEACIQDLGRYLGAESTRPEHEQGEGPDNLFLWTDTAVVIEAKNEAIYKTIPKKDASQLAHSVLWFKQNFPQYSNVIPLFIGPSDKFDRGAMCSPGTRVMMPQHLDSLVEAIDQMIGGLGRRPAGEWSSSEVNELISGFSLNAQNLTQKFSKSIN